MKDIINEFQSNLPPSARRCALRQFSSEVYPKFAIIERGSYSREQKILIMTYPRSTLREYTSGIASQRWRAWMIVKTIGRWKHNWKGWNKDPQKPVTLFSRYTNERKRIGNGANARKTKGWHSSSECSARHVIYCCGKKELGVVKGYAM